MLLKLLFRQGLLCLLIIFFAGAPFPATAQQRQETVCTAAARVFEKTICREDITVEKEHVSAIKQQFEDQGLDSDEAMKSRSIERLENIIWEEALERKFGKEALQPSGEEIAHYSNTLQKSLAQSHAENKKALARVKELLALGGHEVDDELQLRNLQQALETSISFYEERESYNKNMPPEFHQMVKEAEREIAETMIRQWRVNKALYEEYGGRVVMRQGLPEPVDAYGSFLDYIRSEGGLLVLDRDFKNIFAGKEQYIQGSHEAMPDGAEYFKALPEPVPQKTGLPLSD